MRESRTFGSVGGEGSNVLAYPAYSGRVANVATKAAHDPEPMFQVGHTVGRSGARNAAVPSLAVGKRSLAHALFRGVPQFDLGSRRPVAMARVDHLTGGIYRISTHDPESRISFNQFLIDDDEPALVPRHSDFDVLNPRSQ